MAAIDIIDIRAKVASSGEDTDSMRKQIIDGLSQPVGQKTLPTMLLYDERGLGLYDKITTDATEYYLFPAEEQILRDYADEIVRYMHAGLGGKFEQEIIIELGAGALRKTSHILRALSRMTPEAMETPAMTYYALDLEKRELDRTLKELSSSELGAELKGKVATKGLCATYDDGLTFINEGGLQTQANLNHVAAESREPYPVERVDRSSSPSSSAGSRDTEGTPPSTPGSDHPPFHLLFLGSSLGNFNRGEDVEFLKNLPLQAGSGSTLLLGLDHDNDKAKVELAYDDSKGVTRDFIMNGLKVAGRSFGDENLFSEDKWAYVGKYNTELRRHEAYYKSKLQQTVVEPSGSKFEFLPDEMIRIEVSHKYSDRDAFSLFAKANLRPVNRWTDKESQYSLWLLERPQFSFPPLVEKTKNQNPFGLPSVAEWHDMWACWDFINRRLIPPPMLFEKPIDLRHICLFYQGHIPAFADIQIAKVLQEPLTEPESFKYIFERGIDPNVDDPTKIHSHSEVPQKDEDWPSVSSILAYQSHVRERILKIYEDLDSGKRVLTRKIARVLFLTLEHEALHAETLLYMLLQRAGTGTIPPSGFVPPMWELLAESWEASPRPVTAVITLGPEMLSIGHDDDEEQDASTDVAGHDFGWDNEHPKREVQVAKFSIEWRPVTNGEFHDFYVNSGKDKVNFPASWVEVNGEIQVVRTMYGPIPIKIAWHWPIITSCDNLSVYANVKGGRLPTEPELRLFLDKFSCGFEGGANVGFRNWHPVPATTGLEDNGGIGHNGGVWEWTSTVFDRHEGFATSKLYPGYSTDFFDGHHQVVLGGSYATIPRLADRRTLRNWYQHNYPYAWCGARVAYDA
ncbi:DUF323 domain-containing protein [Irpex rosettiformis]|uniref:DUF323 domain-containing protein n=1 Tax=Irpex rosettiformis TaxID=378272 RepID=A0ACB8U0K9_9APHY|nr:DUF323 domain-containing protein [Irpex rosettiformis]